MCNVMYMEPRSEVFPCWCVLWAQRYLSLLCSSSSVLQSSWDMSAVDGGIRGLFDAPRHVDLQYLSLTPWDNAVTETIKPFLCVSYSSGWWFQWGIDVFWALDWGCAVAVFMVETEHSTKMTKCPFTLIMHFSCVFFYFFFFFRSAFNVCSLCCWVLKWNYPCMFSMCAIGASPPEHWHLYRLVGTKRIFTFEISVAFPEMKHTTTTTHKHTRIFPWFRFQFPRHLTPFPHLSPAPFIGPLLSSLPAFHFFPGSTSCFGSAVWSMHSKCVENL